MPVTHQINVTSQVSQFTAEQTLQMPIGVVGTTNAITEINKVIRIRTVGDLVKLGNSSPENTILPFIATLLRYGFGNIFLVQSPFTTVMNLDPEMIANLIKLKETFSLFQEFPRWLLISGGTNGDTVIRQAIDTANACDSMIAVDFPLATTTAQATTVRNTDVALGIKNARLHPCMPSVRVGALTEPLSIHFVRNQARVAVSHGFGFTTSNQPLIDVTGNHGTFRWSYTDPTADNQLLERLGVSTINVNGSNFVSWGNRNGLVSSTNLTWNTYTTLNRIKQELDYLFMNVATGFLGLPSTISTAFLLETALNNIISLNMSDGNYDASSRATFNTQLSNFANRELSFNIVIKCNLPVEIINLNNVYTANI